MVYNNPYKWVSKKPNMTKAAEEYISAPTEFSYTKSASELHKKLSTNPYSYLASHGASNTKFISSPCNTGKSRNFTPSSKPQIARSSKYKFIRPLKTSAVTPAKTSRPNIKVATKKPYYKFTHNRALNKCSQSSPMNRCKQTASSRFKFVSSKITRRSISKSPSSRCARALRTRYKYLRIRTPKRTYTHNNTSPNKQYVAASLLRKVKGIAFTSPKNRYLRRRESFKFRRGHLCPCFVRTGKCARGSNCTYVHDSNYVRICPRYLHHKCPFGRNTCPLSHVLDPCRLPQCEFFRSGTCHRAHCPYLHVTYTSDAAICEKFARGRCPSGHLCRKRHIWSDLSAMYKRNKWNASVHQPTTTQVAHDKIALIQHAGGSSDSSQLTNNVLPLSADDNFLSLSAHYQDVESVEHAVESSRLNSFPKGSLRHVHPAPAFIPLMVDDDTDDSLCV